MGPRCVLSTSSRGAGKWGGRRCGLGGAGDGNEDHRGLEASAVDVCSMNVLSFDSKKEKTDASREKFPISATS
jgi:hypothetical protein